MYSFIDLGLVLLFTLALTGVYFLYEKVLTFKTFSFLKVRQYVIDTISGVFFGLFTLMFKVILMSIDSNFNIPLFFIIAIALLIVRNINSSLVAATIPLIYYAVQFDTTSITYFLITMMSSISIVYIFVEYYANKKWANTSVIISISLFVLVTLPVLGTILGLGYSRVVYESTILTGLFTAVVYYPFRTALRISISANILFESINFVYSRYYRSSLSSEAIGNFIKDGRINKAALGLFEIKVEKNAQENTSEVVETILKSFENEVGKDSVLFAYDENIYGYFVPLADEYSISPLNNDLNRLKDMMKNLRGHYETINNKIVEVNVRTGTSIYGIQSNSISELETNALIALRGNEWGSKDHVSNFNFESYREKILDSKNLALMDEAINLNKFENQYITLANLDHMDEKIVYVETRTNDEYEFTQTADELIRISKWKYTFDRYFAIEAINKIKDGFKYFIEYYPITVKGFSIENFNSRLEKIRVNKDEIVWVISINDINSKNIKDKISNMIKLGFKIAVKHVNNDNVKILDSFEPQYIVVNNENEIKFDDKYTLVNPHIHNENQLLNAIDYNVKYIGGEIIEVGTVVKKIDKQSKIYLEEIITGKKEGK